MPRSTKDETVEPSVPHEQVVFELPPIERPALPTVYIKNRENGWFILDSGDKDTPPLVLSPLYEGPLGNSDFWISNPTLRNFTDPDEGETLARKPIVLFKRTRPFAATRPVPPDLRCDERYDNNVQQICYGPLDIGNDLGGAIDEITLNPQQGNPPRTDVRFLVHTWRLVLDTALWVLRENRRSGREVDSRRIELIERRLEEIENMRLEYGIAKKAL